MILDNLVESVQEKICKSINTSLYVYMPNSEDADIYLVFSFLVFMGHSHRHVVS